MITPTLIQLGDWVILRHDPDQYKRLVIGVVKRINGARELILACGSEREVSAVPEECEKIQP